MTIIETTPLSQRWLYPRSFFSPSYAAMHSWRRFQRLAQCMVPGPFGETLLEENGVFLQGILNRLRQGLSRVRADNPLVLYRTAGQKIRGLLISLAVSLEDRYTIPETREWAQIHAAVDSFSGEDGDLFDLILYAGLSEYLVADLLGAPAEEVEFRWEQARARLCDFLECRV